MSSPRHKKGWETEKETTVLLSEAFYSFSRNYLFMKGYSKHTLSNYRWAINSLIAVTEDIPIENITMEHLVKWKACVERKGWDENTMNSYMYKIRFFIKWWSRKVKLNIDVEDIVIPKKKMKLVKHLTLDEVKAVYKSCEDDRERLIISLLYSTGVRISELSRIRKQDVRGDTLLIRGKGGKERVVYLDPVAKDCMSKYKSTCSYIISGLQGGLTKSGLEKIVRDISRRSGVVFTAHTLRHTHATLLLSEGCNLRHIQELLGHADISTTQMYTHVSNVDLAGAYKKFHVSLD